MTRYSKSYKTSQELVDHLKAKGLAIPDEAAAIEFISRIGFDRLRIYFLSRRNLAGNGKPFSNGVSFNDIIDIYMFDMELRMLLFSAVSKAEIIVKSAMADVVSMKYGSHPYFQDKLYRDNKSHIEAINIFDSVINQRDNDPRWKHYKDHYGEPHFPPIWTMREFMTFGCVNKIITKLNGSISDDISDVVIGVRKNSVLISWVSCLVDLRNMCAHHDRVFNRFFQKTPSKLRLEANNHIPTNANISRRVSALCEVLDHILLKKGEAANIKAELSRMLARHAAVRAEEVGL